MWALATGRDGLGTDSTAHGFRIEYPNDLWDVNVNYKRIGRDFDPSLGFVPRRAVQLLNLAATNRTRLSSGPLQQLTHEFLPFVATDLSGRWESYRIFMAPLNWRFRSGDRVEFNVNPTGERLVTPFEISGVVVPPGSYRWRQYRLEAGTAQKRRFYTQLTWWFGGYYDGKLDQVLCMPGEARDGLLGSAHDHTAGIPLLFVCHRFATRHKISTHEVIRKLRSTTCGGGDSAGSR